MGCVNVALVDRDLQQGWCRNPADKKLPQLSVSSLTIATLSFMISEGRFWQKTNPILFRKACNVLLATFLCLFSRRNWRTFPTTKVCPAELRSCNSCRTATRSSRSRLHFFAATTLPLGKCNACGTNSDFSNSSKSWDSCNHDSAHFSCPEQLYSRNEKNKIQKSEKCNYELKTSSLEVPMLSSPLVNLFLPDITSEFSSISAKKIQNVVQKHCIIFIP